MTRKTVAWARQTKKHLGSSCEAKTQRLAQTLETFLLRTGQVPAAEKIVNLFEEYNDIIRCGKESRPVEYEHKIRLNKVEGGLISHGHLLDANPRDEQR